MNTLQIVLRREEGIEVHSWHMVLGEEIEWTADAPAAVVHFCVIIRSGQGAPAMACVVHRNGVRQNLRVIESYRSDAIRARFGFDDPRSHQVIPGDKFTVEINAVEAADLDTAAPCEFCGQRVVEVHGDPMHEEPICEPWLERDRSRRLASMN